MPVHRGIVRDIIAERNIEIFAEIGVYIGRLIKRIFADQNNRKMLKEYWAIDPWTLYPPSHPPYTEEEWIKMYENVCKVMVEYKQLRVLKFTSVKAASLFPDKYFDFVYIDANHSYKTICEDIHAWLPKIKDGGIMGGHDYNYKGVRHAVSEILGTVFEPQTHDGRRTKVWIKEIER